MSDSPYTKPAELLPHLKEGNGKVGLDLEADSLHRYGENICLMQFCYRDEVALVDPLEDDSLGDLVSWIEGADLWMHGADYDMSLMLGQWQKLPTMLFDTQIAAQLVGHDRFGYASLVEQYFEVELSKSSQKADWGKRPLSPKMIEYAKNDVRYLLPLADALEKKLRELGRYEWFLQSCRSAMEKVSARDGVPRETWRIGGSGKLKPSGLRYLKAVWTWRDSEAEAWNRPCFMVCGNKQLLEWATHLQDGTRVEFSPKMRDDRKRRLVEVIKDAYKIPKEDWPEKIKGERRRKDAGFEAKLKLEIEKRNVVAKDLAIDPSVIVSRAVMEKIVGGVATAEELLLPWQQDLLDL